MSLLTLYVFLAAEVCNVYFTEKTEPATPLIMGKEPNL